MKETLESILFAQSPALFLAALLLIVCYFIRRKNHRVLAVLDLILAILCIALGVALYFLGMSNGLFTIKDFWHVRVPGYVGLGVVAVLFLVLLFRAAKHGIDHRRAERDASRRETAHQKELEEVRQKAYASGMADAMATDSHLTAEEENASPAEEPADSETPAEEKPAE
ncbi:MAG: hypothetical protein II458_04440 [Oscillospiraceae bacterium]|nr:hypothetical protein [Oscillospiraceae bacterium]